MTSIKKNATSQFVLLHYKDQTSYILFSWNNECGTSLITEHDDVTINNSIKRSLNLAVSGGGCRDLGITVTGPFPLGQCCGQLHHSVPKQPPSRNSAAKRALYHLARDSNSPPLNNAKKKKSIFDVTVVQGLSAIVESAAFARTRKFIVTMCAAKVKRTNTI